MDVMRYYDAASLEHVVHLRHREAIYRHGSG
jgi:hypothetical protein